MAFRFSKLTDNLRHVSGKGFSLRPTSLSDAFAVYHASRNPGFNEHLVWKQPASREEAWARVAAVVASMDAGRLTAMSVVADAADDDRCIGQWLSIFRFLPYYDDPRGEQVEMGIWTHPCVWNGRTSIRITKTCIDAAFALTPASELGELFGVTAVTNESSAHLMELCGMREFGNSVRVAESGPDIEVRQFVIERSAWKAARREALFTDWRERKPSEDFLKSMRVSKADEEASPAHATAAAQPSAIEMRRAIEGMREGRSRPAGDGATASPADAGAVAG